MPFKTLEQRRASYRRCKDRILTAERRYRRERPNAKREIQYKRRYGLTLEDFNLLVAAQAGCCAICREALKFEGKRVHVDHCHVTKKVRGILCSRCNVGLGQFQDNPSMLLAAVRYLKLSAVSAG